MAEQTPNVAAATAPQGPLTRLTAWLKENGGPALAVAFFSALAAALSAAVALAQTLLLMNERSTPYRAPLHSAQIDAARNVSATAVQFWEALSAGMAGCAGMQSGQPGWDWDNSVAPRLEREGDAYFDFRKAMFSARVVLSPKVLKSGEELADLVYGAAQTYGSRTCEESVKLTSKFEEDTQSFLDRYAAFLNAARGDAQIDPLSERPDLALPK